MKVALQSTKARSFCMVSVASLVAPLLTVLLVGDVLIHKEGRIDAGIEEMFFSRGNRTVITFRKLLQSGGMKNPFFR
ncbi:hypothetical protein JHK82_046223 [Glycine max]|uniref:Uncharacterized protein n=3 Tax=Glycine subgen. Soja TaxID=1462606 RepID=A0A0R0FFC2_SOYBN|nr:uncharacterized protein LOC100500686 [Glycine max]NP_001386218.1 uncharacterized protein LOC100500686 [Glycine max]KAG4931891.1 hypothetical protein JHK87_045893 [Glycine soja]KAG4929163.1 hypothetical protein JHK86_046124 [Glycine max]KAG4942020.1 hypothetical protein JHK85_046666 [Glycine max]KAG5096369.1 hypothetical protein JHK82_046223 [Glycine max]KAG5101165.1 hypothetical protein JHK84_046134 [Glycine max]|eukprot:XP_025982079.1 uncharacterized protein LOC100500686 isoform X1 [Glycine max]